MSPSPDIHDLVRHLAVLEERMNTLQANLPATLERFEARAARREKDAAKREKDNLRWQIGLWVATIVVLGILVRWPF